MCVNIWRSIWVSGYMEACSVWFPLPPVSISTEQWVSSRTFHWDLNSPFKRALAFHLGISAVKWYTLKVAWTPTSKCCLCFCSCCVLHGLLWGKEGAKTRLSRQWGANHHWPPCKCHGQQICSHRDSQFSGYTAFPNHILQPVWLQTAPFHNLLKHFLLLSLSFTCFFFPPQPWSVGCSLPPLFDSADTSTFPHLASTACCCCLLLQGLPAPYIVLMDSSTGFLCKAVSAEIDLLIP